MLIRENGFAGLFKFRMVFALFTIFYFTWIDESFEVS
jgi:hypothetical protein